MTAGQGVYTGGCGQEVNPTHLKEVFWFDRTEDSICIQDLKTRQQVVRRDICNYNVSVKCGLTIFFVGDHCIFSLLTHETSHGGSTGVL